MVYWLQNETSEEEMYVSEFQQGISEQITVYIDILLFVNLIMNGAILFASAKLTGAKTSFGRFAAADLIVSGYGLTVCLPSLGFFVCTVTKTTVAILVSAVAFKTRSLRALLKHTCIFLFCYFGYLAVLMSVQALPFCESSIYIQNNEIYFNIPVPTVIISALFLLLAANIAGRISASRKPSRAFCDCEVSLAGKTVKLRCFKDSGNMLKDSITGDPVMIAEKSIIKNVTDDLYKNTRIRIIPYRTADGKSGILYAFRPDSVKIDGETRRMLIAVSDTKLGDEFNAIIGQ